MNIFEALIWDHTRIAHLLNKLERTPSDAAQERDELFTRVKHVLLPHRRFEEEILFPEILHVKRVQIPVTEAYEGHRTAGRLVDELEASEKSSEEWLCAFVVFKACLNHHMREEESRVFLEASRILGSERAQDMAERYKQNTRGWRAAESAWGAGDSARSAGSWRGTPFARLAQSAPCTRDP